MYDWESWDNTNFEDTLKGRYINFQVIKPLLNHHKNHFRVSAVGKSVMGKEIFMIDFGNGTKNVLMWSQMHGNETTCTKALFDFLKFVEHHKTTQSVHRLLSEYHFYIIPILNIDGAHTYTRENANKVDLNRDFQKFSQPESSVLKQVFEKVKPGLCLNMHDQRTIFGVDKYPATISFLSPAADSMRSITAARRHSMELIEKMNVVLQAFIPNQVGRYDDTFNLNCAGDYFQHAGVPTILFEAGHFPNDYQRETTRKYIFLSLLALFDFICIPSKPWNSYHLIPENVKIFRDIIFRNVKLSDSERKIDILVQYKEILEGSKIKFKAVIDDIGEFPNLIGHREIDCTNSNFQKINKDMIKKGAKLPYIFNKNGEKLTSFS